MSILEAIQWTDSEDEDELVLRLSNLRQIALSSIKNTTRTAHSVLPHKYDRSEHGNIGSNPTGVRQSYSAEIERKRNIHFSAVTEPPRRNSKRQH